PKPSAPSGANRSHALSNPLANPTGLASGTPATVVANAGSATAWPMRRHGRGSASIASATRWDRSGSSAKNARRPNASYQPRGLVASVAGLAGDYAHPPVGVAW